MTDDLHRSHPPATGTSIENPAHTRPVTCNFTMHTAQWAKLHNTYQQWQFAPTSDGHYTINNITNGYGHRRAALRDG